MFELKTISKESIPGALEKAQRYRHLNEPAEAESICLDVLAIDPENQQAIVMLLLATTDQFDHGKTSQQAQELLPRLNSEYDRAYYAGIIFERWAKAHLHQSGPGSGFGVYHWLLNAMKSFETAEKLRPQGNQDALLRWNACARILMNNPDLKPTPEERFEPFLE